MLKHLLALIVITSLSLWLFWNSPDNPLMTNAELSAPQSNPGAVPGPDFYKLWLPYRDSIYKNVGVTTSEIKKLNELAKKLTAQHSTYAEHVKKIERHFPKIGVAIARVVNKNLPLVIEKESKMLLGNSRYEYLIKAKKTFFESYNKKNQSDFYIPEW